MKMFGFDTLDWRQVKIDWDAITDDIIKAGTPMDKDGHICNDGNVFGILMDDVQRKRNVQGRVVISGCMDMKAAEEHSGITLSAEAKAALPDIWTQGGGVTDYNKLENRPFGSNGVQMVEIFPETKLAFEDSSYSAEGKVALTVGQTYTVKWNGVDYVCTCKAVDMGGVDLIYLGNLDALQGTGDSGEPFIFGVMPDASAIMVYTLDDSESATVSVIGEAESIDRMESKFLTEGTPFTEPFDDAILAETVLADAQVGSGSLYSLPIGKIVPGDIYNVVFDGVAYPVKAYITENAMITLGTGNMGSTRTFGVPYANVPFMFNIYPKVIAEEYGGNANIVFAEGFEPTTIAILGGETVGMIDEACLHLACTPLVLKLTKSGSVYTSNLPKNAIMAAVTSQQPVWVYVYGDADDISWFPMSGSGSVIYQYDGDKYYAYTWQDDTVMRRTEHTITTT